MKIGDLGIARELSRDSACAHTMVGTPYYLSPELCEGRGYNDKVSGRNCLSNVRVDTNHSDVRATYGPSDASCMRWQRVNFII